MHEIVEEQLLLGPTAEAGPPWAGSDSKKTAMTLRKCPLMRERSLVIVG